MDETGVCQFCGCAFEPTETTYSTICGQCANRTDLWASEGLDTLSICQCCKRTFDPESYLIVEKTMTLPEKCQTYYTICPDCEQSPTAWESDGSIEIKRN